MSNTLKFGNGQWATKEGSTLAYNDENNNFKPLPFNFERGSSATVVNKDGLIETVGSDMPRIDYKDDSEGALLLEPQRTNLITYSEDFSNAAWNFKSNVNLQSGMLSPKGDLNAYKITATTTDNSYIGGFLNQNTDKYKSIWARTVSGNGKVNLLNVRTEGSTDGLFNLSEEWTRFEILHDGVDIFYGVDFRNSLSTLNEIIVYGAQLEAGSYATSYIPTQGSAVTRLADVCNNGANEQVINSTEGVLYAEISALSDDVLSDQRSIQLEGLNGGSNNEIIIQYISGDLRFLVYGNSNLQLNTSQSVSLSSYTKVALLYKNNVFKIYINGIERYNVSGSYTMPTNLNKLNFSRSGVSIFYGKVKDVRVYNTVLTDQELEALTS